MPGPNCRAFSPENLDPVCGPLTPSGSVEGVQSELKIELFHLGTRKVAEVIPHLGLPIWGPSRRHAL